MTELLTVLFLATTSIVQELSKPPNASWEMLFDGWTPVIRTLIVGGLAYGLLVSLLRASGK